jgi:hypothetical protein
MEIKDRIKEFRRVKASDLLANPLNHRIHSDKQRKKLRTALKDIGFAGACLAREDEKGQLILIDGHMRASECGESEIPVLILNVSEIEANKILASFDAIGAMADIDQRILDDLVKTFANDDPFKTDGIKEALEPAEDIIKRQKEAAKKELEHRIEQVKEYKDGKKDFGIGPNEWWRLKDGKLFFTGTHKHPLYLKGITEFSSYHGNKYYTIFVHSPIDDPEESLVDEQFISISDEVWTLTNNNWRNIKPILDRGYVKGIYPFTCGGQSQIAIFESNKRDEPFNKIECGSVSARPVRQSKGRTCDPMDLPEPTNGSVLVTRAAESYFARTRKALIDNSYLPIFIVPNVDTGRLFRIFYNGHYSKCFFSERNTDKCQPIFANAFKYMPAQASLAQKASPPRRIKKWIMPS